MFLNAQIAKCPKAPTWCHAYLHTYTPTSIHVCLYTCCIYLSTCLPTHLHASIPTRSPNTYAHNDRYTCPTKMHLAKTNTPYLAPTSETHNNPPQPQPQPKPRPKAKPKAKAKAPNPSQAQQTRPTMR